ncbi:MAG: SH3 domain-containing protein [Hyphomicrobiales bacterium]
MAFRRDRIFALAGLCVGACFVLAAVLSIVFSQGSATASYGNDANAVKAMPPAKLGPSGLPVPRFVSLKRKKVNVRKGPSTDHRVKWVYTSKGYPVEIIAESDNWRRVRDAQGDEGWVFHSLLSGSRTAIISPWGEATQIPMLSEPHAGSPVVASLSSGVMGLVDNCNGEWCMVAVTGYSGWVEQGRLWGIYPGERFQ